MKKTVKNAGRLNSELTEYLNVDLDIYSRVSLKGLVDAMGEEAIVLYVGGERQEYGAHVAVG